MYEADDIIDMAKLEGNKSLADHRPSARKSTSFAGSSFCSCLPNIKRRHEIAVQVRNFNIKLEKISKLGERFLKIQNMQPKEAHKVKTWQLVEPNLVGKEILHDCRKLTEMILSNYGKTSYKLGIVGTGGVGKTTLAQKLYNDHKIKGKFSKQVWICVSQVYSAIDLLKEILRNLDVQYGHDETVGELSVKITAAIQHKSFFLVLDDIWHHEVWTNLLRTPFCNATAGIVVITTRNDTVARAIGVEYMHRVDLMSPEVGWELLWKSMDTIEDTEVQNLNDIGLEIIRLCGGLPLAIKVTASVLATKDRNLNKWRKVINKSAWSMIKLPIELRGALYLSYDELPQYLKQCFLYCALYPEDYRMHRDDLVRCWIAEGFVQEQEEQLVEDTAEEYYYELLYRNLLQPDPNFLDYSRCKMHDLIRKLAQHLSGEELFCGDPQSLEVKSFTKLRRISIFLGKELLSGAHKEQTGVRTLTTTCKELKVDNTIFKRFPKIRILDLTGSIIQCIPDCIGSLIYLRLLDLDGTDIAYLPESICCLTNLQILNLERCDSLHNLPSGITKLCNLRRLGLRTTPINKVPNGIGRLSFLNDLEGFPVGGGYYDNSTRMHDGWNLEELGHLPNLRKLGMINLEKAAHGRTCSLLTEKKYLKKLYLHCTEHSNETYSREDAINIERSFMQLVPPHNLEELHIFGFFSSKYPSWLGSTTYLSSLKFMNLINCKSCVHLPPIGQLPNLKYFKINGATSVTKIGHPLVGCGVGNPVSTEVVAFPKLETLVIKNMPNWEEWTFAAPPPKMQLLPRLKKLYLECCPKLIVLPWQLGQEATRFEELQLRHVGILNLMNFSFLSEILLISGCNSLDRVSNIPQVRRLRVRHCPKLIRVEELGNLEQLWLDEGMQEVSSLWVPGLKQLRQQLHGEDLDICTWPNQDALMREHKD
ncbi:unnamed protein product [Urochloa decumbens]|uniref:NB-ARC domain-containing protein n=1 Tax=Urochloa decumbens TaxID=240449 RepID=A0ABC9AZE2_9POAL